MTHVRESVKAVAASLRAGRPTSIFKESWNALASYLPDRALPRPKVYSKGPQAGNRIALTFDDGPTPGVTDTLLTHLDKRDVCVTFFMIGDIAEANPSLTRDVVAAGHEIGNHTYTHPPLNEHSEERVLDEIKKSQDVISDITGTPPVWFRPPFGAFLNNQRNILRDLNLDIVYWSVDPEDWLLPGAQTIIRRVDDRTDAGSIVLLHDNHSQIVEAVPELLDRLIDKGHRLTPLSPLLKK